MKRAGIILGLVLSAAGCTPKVVVEVPKEPITFNINIKLDAEVRVVTRGLMQAENNLMDRVPVDMRSIDLEKLFPLLGVIGLDGTGRLSGTVPLRITDGKLAIGKGALRAVGPGRIRFAGPALARQLLEHPETATTVSAVLADYHYRTLTMRLDKPAGDIGTALLHMEGSNPAAYDGRTVVFNIRIESDYRNFKRRCLPRRSETSGQPGARRDTNGCGIVELRKRRDGWRVIPVL